MNNKCCITLPKTGSLYIDIFHGKENILTHTGEKPYTYTRRTLHLLYTEDYTPLTIAFTYHKTPSPTDEIPGNIPYDAMM